MGKRIQATKWEVIVRDNTGAMVNIDYVCPYCHMATGNFITIGASNVGKLDNSWETDQVCPECEKALIIECL